MKLSLGSRSLLYGVHAFWFHPITVWLAWFALFGKLPKWHENVAIFCHDLGYAGCSGMDNAEGRRHPIRGADLTFRVVYRLRHAWLNFSDLRPNWENDDDAWALAESARKLSLGHSRFFAKQAGIPVSKLFAADKASIYFDPKSFYLLRARLSGEIDEYVANSSTPNATPEEWFDGYLRTVGELI